MAINGHIIYDKPLQEVKVVIDQLTADTVISWVSIWKTEGWTAKGKGEKHRKEERGNEYCVWLRKREKRCVFKVYE